MIYLSKRAKNYVEKREEESGNISYIYPESWVKKRWKKKENKIKQLDKNISKLRDKVKEDLKSDDEKTKLTALIVSLIDSTKERIGNEESAKDRKHYGVSTWLVKHIIFSDGKVKIKFVGKSGVNQEKEVKEKYIINALKDAVKDKKKNNKVFETDDFVVTPSDVNKYLKKFKISTKDIRGAAANQLFKDELKKQRKGKLPKDEKEKEKKLKEELNKALENVSEKLGHEPSTLKNQYILPKTLENYLSSGKLASSSFILSKRADNFIEEDEVFEEESFTEEEEKEFEAYWDRLGEEIEREKKTRKKRKRSDMTLDDLEFLAELDSDEREEWMKEHFVEGAFKLSKRAEEEDIDLRKYFPLSTFGSMSADETSWFLTKYEENKVIAYLRFKDETASLVIVDRPGIMDPNERLHFTFSWPKSLNLGGLQYTDKLNKMEGLGLDKEEFEDVLPQIYDLIAELTLRSEGEENEVPEIELEKLLPRDLFSGWSYLNYKFGKDSLMADISSSSIYLSIKKSLFEDIYYISLHRPAKIGGNVMFKEDKETFPSERLKNMIRELGEKAQVIKLQGSFKLSKRAQELQLKQPGAQILIEPYDSAVARALSQLPFNLKQNITKVVVHSEGGPGQLGHVEMGPSKDPREVHIFKNRINEQVKRMFGTSQPTPQQLEQATHTALIETLVHEGAHIGTAPQEQILDPSFRFKDESSTEQETARHMRTFFPNITSASLRLDNIRKKFLPSLPMTEPDIEFVVYSTLNKKYDMVKKGLSLLKDPVIHPAIHEIQSAIDFNKNITNSMAIKMAGSFDQSSDQDTVLSIACWQLENNLKPTGKLDTKTLNKFSSTLSNLPRNFGIVVPNKLYRGGIIDKITQLQDLKDRFGVERIISLHNSPEISKMCNEIGMEHLPAPIEIGNPKEYGRKILGSNISELLLEKPTYIHCWFGADRAGGVIARFRTESGWSNEEAYKEAKAYGFKDMFVDLLDWFYETGHGPKPVNTKLMRRILNKINNPNCPYKNPEISKEDPTYPCKNLETKEQDAFTPEGTPTDQPFRDLSETWPRYERWSDTMKSINPIMTMTPPAGITGY